MIKMVTCLAASWLPDTMIEHQLHLTGRHVGRQEGVQFQLQVRVGGDFRGMIGFRTIGTKEELRRRLPRLPRSSGHVAVILTRYRQGPVLQLHVLLVQKLPGYIGESDLRHQRCPEHGTGLDLNATAGCVDEERVEGVPVIGCWPRRWLLWTSWLLHLPGRWFCLLSRWL